MEKVLTENLKYVRIYIGKRGYFMECIICGKTEEDFEKANREIIEKLDKVLDIIKNKREVIKNKIKDNEEINAKYINNLGNKFLHKFIEEIAIIERRKSTIKKISFVEAESYSEILKNDITNDYEKIVEKYLKIREQDNNFFVCTHCKTIIDKIVAYKIDEIKEKIDKIFFYDYEYIYEEISKMVY